MVHCLSKESKMAMGMGMDMEMNFMRHLEKSVEKGSYCGLRLLDSSMIL